MLIGCGEMCRADLAPNVQEPVARLLNDIAAALALEAGVDPKSVRIGPIDFGEPHGL